MVRTTLDKLQATGVIVPDGRGGRQGRNAVQDAQIKLMMNAHIDRCPRVESHYCRSGTTKEYLHPDLNIKKMYEMYKAANPEEHIGSEEKYRLIFESRNLSFHSPKKDQCSLCMSYKEGDVEAK